MSMDRVSMALDDVVKADRKANKGNKNGNKKAGGPGANKKNGRAPRGAVKQPATAQLVKKLVKRALAQRGVGAKNRNIRPRNTVGGTRTIVKKIVRRVPNTPRGHNRSLGISQRSRTIVRRSAPQPQRTIVREVRYIRDPPQRQAPRVQQQRRVVYAQPPPPRRVVYVDSPRRQQRFGGSSFSSRRPAAAPRRNMDPFYEPRNYLQRVTY